jgi:outer membrane lipoprotein-sorting protein
MPRLLLACLGLVVLCLAGCNSKQPTGNVAKEPDKPAATQPETGTAKEAAVAADKDSPAAAKPFQDEPAAHALYNQMIEALRKADSLSYVSHYAFKGNENFSLDCTYRAWLKKPNYFRLETESSKHDKGGILVGDGNTLWIYWPEGRPLSMVDDQSEADQKTRFSSYMTHPAPLAAHSIGHEVGYLGAGMSMPIIDPSTFHGYTDSLQAYVDGVMSLPAEKVGDDDCDGIEVSIMKHQRSWYIWLSKADHLPRKMKEVVRVSYDLIITEDWSSVAVNADMPDTLFAWKPPEGWTQWKYPPLEAGLLKPGVEAPDFELASADGGKIKLSDYRGKVVWFYVWRAG